MKIENYQRICARNLDLATALRNTIGPPIFTIYARRDETQVLRYVEDKLHYIAFRPIEQLDLENGNHMSTSGGLNRHVTHLVFAQVDGYEGPCSRIRPVDSSQFEDEEPLLSIRAVLQYLVDWHAECEVFDGLPLIINCIARSTMSWQVDVPDGGIVKQELELFRPPADFLSAYKPTR